nr:DUF4105 domain-containing protein [Polymorphobacter fuscus]
MRAAVTLLALVPATLWGTMALWSRLPFAAPARGLVAGLFALLMLAAIALLWRQRPRVALAIIVPAWAALLGWWSTILPSDNRNWQPDVAQVARTRIDGDVLTVDNVRNFTWRSDTDFDVRWETRRYRLSQLQGADLFLSYWAGESIAHAIISFTFADSDPLAFSVEIRKEKGEAYSAVAGFFKSYELAVLAADERDIVKVRSTVLGEDVRLFRLDIQRATALGLLREYAALANDVHATPRWYNTLMTNCTTVIFGMARRLDPRIRLDWRILLPGRLPSYLREKAFVSRAVPLPELIARSHIGPRAAAPPPDPGFSNRIRDGVPDPAGAPAARP